jgi:predicted DNA-binding protein with PD1-like motif
MHAKLLSNIQGQRIFSVVLAKNDDVLAALQDFIVGQNLHAAQFTAIGAFQNATLGYFDWERKDYIRIDVPEQVEVASLLGDVALGENGKPALHVHCVLSQRDGNAKAGHLLHAIVRPTLEVILTESPAYLRKRHDPESDLALIDPSE